MKKIDEMDTGIPASEGRETLRGAGQKPRLRFTDEVWPGVKPGCCFCWNLSISLVRILSFLLFEPATDFIQPKFQEKISDIHKNINNKVNHHNLRKT